MTVKIMKAAYGFFLLTDVPLIRDQLDCREEWFRCFKDKRFTIFASVDLQDDLAECGIPKQIRALVQGLYPDSDF